MRVLIKKLLFSQTPTSSSIFRGSSVALDMSKHGLIEGGRQLRPTLSEATDLESQGSLPEEPVTVKVG